MATVTFHGAAQEVTGSCHLISIPGHARFLLDCGMHQGGDAIERIGAERFSFDPGHIDFVILSHAHLDHSGLLPKLVANGFEGPIYCSNATTDLLPIMLDDAAGLYFRDIERENEKRERRGQDAVEPEYTEADVKQALSLCHGLAYGEAHTEQHGITICLRDAGHILGSAIVEVSFDERGHRKKLVFSGDLGKQNSALMNDPEIVTEANLLLMESTYGDRDHRTLDNSLEQIAQVLSETWDAGGNVMIPAFAVGRTQELLYYLGQLHQQDRLAPWQIFLDSPMAIKVTEVYDRWLHTMDCKDVRALCDSDKSFLKDFLPRLQLTSTPDESMSINKIKKGAIIIAGSGMCTGGRIRHHIKHRIWDKRNTLIFAGFQARGTLGRILVDGAKRIKLFGDEYMVRARIETINGFSAHAGQTELVQWAGHFTSQPQVCLVHGEPEAQDALATRLWQEKGIEANIPQLHQTIAF